MNLIQIILFLIVAALAGTAANALTGESKESTVANTLLGIVGAFVGQFLFSLLDIGFSGALNEGITIAEVLIAIIGALIVIYTLRALRKS